MALLIRYGLVGNSHQRLSQLLVTTKLVASAKALFVDNVLLLQFGRRKCDNSSGEGISCFAERNVTLLACEAIRVVHARGRVNR